MWVKDNSKPKKLDKSQKAKISGEVEKFIQKSEKLSKSVNRIFKNNFYGFPRNI